MAPRRRSSRPAPPPAKVTVPSLPRILRRTRVFTELDEHLRRPLVWVVGPPGAGKTTLVASYLRARRRPVVWLRLDDRDGELSSFVHFLGLAARPLLPPRVGLPVFTADVQLTPAVFLRRLFERLERHLPRRTVIVFDDYHRIPDHSPVHTLLAETLHDIAGLPVVTISRTDPPPAYASLFTTGELAMLGPDRLLLAPDELRALVGLHHPSAGAPARRAWQSRARLAQGWLAGTTLLLREAPPDTRTRSPRDDTPQAVFGLLAREALDRATDAHRRFLLLTSLLTEFTAGIADAVTGASFAATYLDALHRGRFFVERTEGEAQWYRYHPLFRAVLREEASRRMSAEAMRDVHARAGRALVAACRLDEGIPQLVDGHDWDALRQAIIDIAPAVIAQERHAVLAGWIRAIPDERRVDDPDLLLWLATSLVSIDPPEADRLARHAAVAFDATGASAGRLAAWSVSAVAIIAAFRDLAPLDALIDTLPCDMPADLPALPPLLQFQVTTSIATALMWRRPGDARTNAWVQRARELRSAQAPGTVVGGIYPGDTSYYVWLGDLTSAASAAESFQRSRRSDEPIPVARLAFLCARAVLGWVRGDIDDCRRTVDDGLALARREGLLQAEYFLLAQSAYNELFAGNLEAVRALLHRTSPPAGDPGAFTCHAHFLAAWAALLHRDLATAWDLLRPERHRAGALVGPFAEGVAAIVRAFTAHAAGRLDVAAAEAASAAAIADRMHSGLLRHGAAFAEALCAFSAGDDAGGSAALARALALGRDQQLFGCPGWDPRAVSGLLSRAIEAGIETDYLRELLRRRWIPRPAGAISARAWLWPVTIRALGGFEIRVDGQPLPRGRKAPHRLLDCLRALIALGGTHVATADLVDALWPDVDGDTARENLDKTLQRLRRLLGHGRVITTRGGTVSIDPDLCWVDALAFAGADTSPSTDVRDALALYRGPLFDGLVLETWELSARERLAAKARTLAARAATAP